MVNPAQHSGRSAAGQDTRDTRGARGRLGLVWVAGLVVALGAGVATAHGLYEVAIAAGTPRVLAWLYPLITDGLALVAYATTTRLAVSGRRYAWSVVVIAAGLSGLTQAGYLAGGVAQAPPVLRFAIGAWPAIAAAIVAHLLYLLGGGHHPMPPEPEDAAEDSATRSKVLPPVPARPTVVPVSTLAAPGPQPLPASAGNRSEWSAAPPTADLSPSAVVRRLNTPLNAEHPVEQAAVQPVEHPPGDHQPGSGKTAGAPAADRSRTLAREHAARHGHLPTVTELVTLARVARGTAAAALKDLRQHPARQPAGKPASNTRRHP
jgi:hypothetical protein